MRANRTWITAIALVHPSHRSRSRFKSSRIVSLAFSIALIASRAFRSRSALRLQSGVSEAFAHTSSLATHLDMSDDEYSEDEYVSSEGEGATRDLDRAHRVHSRARRDRERRDRERALGGS